MLGKESTFRLAFFLAQSSGKARSEKGNIELLAKYQSTPDSSFLPTLFGDERTGKQGKAMLKTRRAGSIS